MVYFTYAFGINAHSQNARCISIECFIRVRRHLRKTKSWKHSTIRLYTNRYDVYIALQKANDRKQRTQDRQTSRGRYSEAGYQTTYVATSVESTPKIKIDATKRDIHAHGCSKSPKSWLYLYGFVFLRGRLRFTYTRCWSVSEIYACVKAREALRHSKTHQGK